MYTLISYIHNPQVNPKDKLTFINYINYHQTSKNPGEIKSILPSITLLINTAESRSYGLFLLKEISSQAPVIFSEIEWGKSLIKYLEDPENALNKKLICQIFLDILDFMSKRTDLLHFIKTSLFPELIPQLLQLKDNDQWAYDAIKCLTSCMQNFPFFMAPNQILVENLIIRFLDVPSDKIIQAISDCFLQLPQCIENNKSSQKLENWEKYFFKIFNTLNKILHEISKTIQLENIPIKEFIGFGVLDIPNLQYKSFDARISMNIQIFSSLCVCFGKFISKFPSDIINLPLESLLRFLLIIFSIPSSQYEKTNLTSNMHYMFSIMLEMQMAAFVILEELIFSYDGYLSACSDIFKDIFESALKSTKTRTQISSSFRCRIYKTLRIWINQFGVPNSMLDGLILQELIDEIKCKNKSSENFKLSIHTINRIMEALETLTCMFYASPINADIIQELQVYLIELFITFDSNLSQTPYSNEKCRFKLYKLLLALVLKVHINYLEIQSCAIKIFQKAKKDPYFEISSFANEALTCLLSRIHVSKDYSPMYMYSQEKEETKDIQKLLYYRNEQQNLVFDEENTFPIVTNIRNFENIQLHNSHIQNHNLPNNLYYNNSGDDDENICESEAYVGGEKSECNGLKYVKMDIDEVSKAEDSPYNKTEDCVVNDTNSKHNNSFISSEIDDIHNREEEQNENGMCEEYQLSVDDMLEDFMNIPPENNFVSPPTQNIFERSPSENSS